MNKTTTTTLAVLFFAIFYPSIQADPKPIQFMEPSVLQPFQDALPAVKNTALKQILASQSTMWYDSETMVPVYQDSVTPVIGVRANTVGIQIAVEGDRVFNEEGFDFPFRKTAGTDEVKNIKVLTFWSPAQIEGKIQPVVFYEDNTTRYRWIFPVGTVFGEALFMYDSKGNPFCFEIRTRTRYSAGWDVDLFRPFVTAKSLADAIIVKRPNWQSDAELKRLVQHLYNPDTLQAKKLSPTRYLKVSFEEISGSLDVVPGTRDEALIKELLEKTPFVSTVGQLWKRSEKTKMETYGPASDQDFHIVPGGYQGGLFPANEVSCNRCHQDTGRQVGEYNFNTLLYGEVWGEDRIFSWHLFDPNNRIYGAFDRNRKLNPRMVAAKLITPYNQSVHGEELYKPLERRFRIRWR